MPPQTKKARRFPGEPSAIPKIVCRRSEFLLERHVVGPAVEFVAAGGVADHIARTVEQVVLRHEGFVGDVEHFELDAETAQEIVALLERIAELAIDDG